MEEPVTIVDRDVLKVLAVDTRMDILKLLQKGERMPSYLSKELGKSNPTIIEHLDALQKAGLVSKLVQPHKKFVFYTLTEKGQGILSSRSRRLVIVLSSSVVSLFASAFFTFLASTIQYSPFRAAAPKQLAQEAFSTASEVAEQAILPQASPLQPGINPYLIIAIVLFVLAVVGFIYYFRQRKNWG